VHRHGRRLPAGDAVSAPRVRTALGGEAGLPRWFATSFSMLEGLQTGRLDLALPDGRVFRIEGARPGPAARLDIRNAGLFARVAREGELGFGEAYLDGWWDTPDLLALLDVILSNHEWVERAHPLSGLLGAYRRLHHWLRRNSRAQARRNIAAHYDLGNAFYACWLDETMTYSAALFEDPGEELAVAQRRKYDRICERIGVREGACVLEIGCGWGGFAAHSARRGAHVTGLTISREQHDFARRRIFEAGLAERVEIVLRDYRDERGRYDGIASIEMIEAVGERYWPGYFDVVHDRLRPGGAAALQAITVSDALWPTYRRTADFIQTYIFPGGMLLSPGRLRAEAGRAGLAIDETFAFGPSYSLTLRGWLARFDAAWPEIATMGFDDRFRRMWRFYLAACAASFKSGQTDVAQVTLRRR
jgi:cyclopropane-fatty-acyl-phospholipid synthase